MPNSQSAADILERHALEMRCGLLDLAAALDRLQRAPGAEAANADPRLTRIREGLKILLSTEPARAERIQKLFSDEYVAGWIKDQPKKAATK
jgi:hypothetical protein